jgi:hypothetical protein
MTWKPTEGELRAEWIVREIRESGEACYNIVGGVLAHRMYGVIAKAIDLALADGRADAEEKVKSEAVAAQQAAAPSVISPIALQGNGKLYPGPPDDTPEYRAAFPYDPRLAPAVTEEAWRPVPNEVVADELPPRVSLDEVPQDEPPTKKGRGRPKGAKNKPKEVKKAKGKAKGKTKPAPVIESYDPPEIEPVAPSAAPAEDFGLASNAEI